MYPSTLHMRGGSAGLKTVLHVRFCLRRGCKAGQVAILVWVCADVELEIIRRLQLVCTVADFVRAFVAAKLPRLHVGTQTEYL